MASSTWDLQVVMSESDDTVYAHATLSGAPRLAFERPCHAADETA
jgi:hypothetical protein